jgi:hypothetical protein
MPLPPGLSSLKWRSEDYNSMQFQLYGKVTFLCWNYTNAPFKYSFYICYILFVCVRVYCDMPPKSNKVKAEEGIHCQPTAG